MASISSSQCWFPLPSTAPTNPTQPWPWTRATTTLPVCVLPAVFSPSVSYMGTFVANNHPRIYRVRSTLHAPYGTSSLEPCSAHACSLLPSPLVLPGPPALSNTPSRVCPSGPDCLSSDTHCFQTVPSIHALDDRRRFKAVPTLVVHPSVSRFLCFPWLGRPVLSSS